MHSFPIPNPDNISTASNDTRISGKTETKTIFVDPAKDGVVHLMTTKFILLQNSLIASSKKEFIDKVTETEMIFVKVHLAYSATIGLQNIISLIL